jgi:drug/metabolite transporter (DMT)-like permease
MSQYIYDLRYKKSLKGIIFNSISALLFYFATVMVHKGLQVNHNSDAIIYAFYRYYLGSVFFFILILIKKIPISLKIPIHVLLRGIFNSIAVILFYFAIQFGETGRANVLNMTYPVFVAIISGPILKEYPNFKTIVSLFLCISGIFLHFYEPLTQLTHNILFSDLLGLSSGIISAFAIISLRGSAKMERSEIILFWMFFIGILFSLPFCYKKIFLLDKLDLLYLMASAIMGVLGQWLLTISYRYMDATTGSIISGLRIPIAILYGWLFLSEPFSVFSWIGGLLIFSSNILIALRK